MQLETVSRAFAKLKARDLLGLVSAEQVVLHRRGAARREEPEQPGASALL
jgi:hypothetical protein